MNHLDTELELLKHEAIAMWKLVISQLKKTQTALVTFNKDLAREVVKNESLVNDHELKIDEDCENIFALFNPVAVDLRFVLSVLKINNNLERTGDIADGIARFVVSAAGPFDTALIDSTQIILMYEEACDMMEDLMHAFETEDTSRARQIMQRDSILDEINIKATGAVAAFIRSKPEHVEQALYILSAIRKLERVGDQCKNIAEELIFYVEAKVLKHKDSSGKNQ